MTIRVLVVDDSSFIRRAVTRMLTADAEISVVGHAAHGSEALEMLRTFAPDVVTLDLEMPSISGLDTLRLIMAERPTPVILLSAYAQTDAARTLEALAAGAVDFVDKSSVSRMDVHALAEELVRKVKAAARSHPRASAWPTAPDSWGSLDALALSPGMSTLVIGASTGGPPAVQLLLSKLPRTFAAAVVVVQHMPPVFTRAFAMRLDACSELAVKEAEPGDRVEAGRVLVAPGGHHVTFRHGDGAPEVVLHKDVRDAVHVPSVDVAATSAASIFGRAACLAVLTGMGTDGTEGARAIRGAGGVVVAQDEETCVIYGMPRAVAREGLAHSVLPLDKMPELFGRLARRRARVR